MSPCNSREEDRVDCCLHNDHLVQQNGSECLRSTPPPVTSRHWADRDDEVVIVWDNKDRELVEAKDIKPFKVAEKIEKFLSNALSSVVPNTTNINGKTSMGHPTLWPLPALIWTKS